MSSGLLLQLQQQKWQFNHEFREKWRSIVNTPCPLDQFIYDEFDLTKDEPSWIDHNKIYIIKEALLFLLEYIQTDEPASFGFCSAEQKHGRPDLALREQVRRINYCFALILHSLDLHVYKNIVKEIYSLWFTTSSEIGTDPSKETLKLKYDFSLFLNIHYPGVDRSKLYLPID